MPDGTEFGAGAQLTVEVDPRSLSEARAEIEEEIGDVTVGVGGGGGAAGALTDGGAGGAMGAVDQAAVVDELGDQTDILEELLDEIETGGLGSGGDGGGGPSLIETGTSFLAGLKAVDVLKKIGGAAGAAAGGTGGAAAATAGSGLTFTAGLAEAMGTWSEGLGVMTGGGTGNWGQQERNADLADEFSIDLPEDWSGDKALQDILENSDLTESDVGGSPPPGAEDKGPLSLSDSDQWETFVKESDFQDMDMSKWREVFSMWQSSIDQTETVTPTKLNDSVGWLETVVGSLEDAYVPEPDWPDSVVSQLEGLDIDEPDWLDDAQQLAASPEDGDEQSSSTESQQSRDQPTPSWFSDAESLIDAGVSGVQSLFGDGGGNQSAQQSQDQAAPSWFTGEFGAGAAGTGSLISADSAGQYSTRQQSGSAPNRAAEQQQQQRRNQVNVNATAEVKLSDLRREMDRLSRDLKDQVLRDVRREMDGGR